MSNVLFALKKNLGRKVVAAIVQCIDVLHRLLIVPFERFRKPPLPFDGRVPPPDWVCIETTRYCNLRCRMCLPFLDGITVTGPHMSIEEFSRYAKEVFPFARTFQPSVSGEPLVTKDFEAMVAAAKSYGVKMEMTTNGTRLTPRLVETIIPILEEIDISFDGATKATFERIREGSNFEKVLENIRCFAVRRRELPREGRPRLTLNVTLMASNVGELADIVKIGHELGVDEVKASHVLAATDEMRRESLIHHLDFGRTAIARAVGVAEDLGVALYVAPLDCLTAAVAQEGTRAVPTEANGTTPLPGVSVGRRSHRSPALAVDRNERHAIAKRRAEGAATSTMLEPRWASPFGRRQAPIWVCEFLWRKTFIHIDGEVRPCCIVGPPVLGNLNSQSLSEVWDGEHYRVMRQHLAARRPVDACKGCRYIREIKDPLRTDYYLQGRRVPADDELLPIPATLKGVAAQLPAGKQALTDT